MASGTIIDTVALAGQLARMKGHDFTFAGYEWDDIQQEIWLMVHEASGRFDPTKTVRAISFFNVHTQNRLHNLVRDKKNQTRDKPTAHDRPIIKIDNSFTEDLELNDLITYMESNMPSSLKESFKCMWYYGGEGLTAYAKKNVRNAVARLLKRYKNE